MFLNEPPQTQYDLRFRVLGIPVRVHPLFWLVTLLMGLRGTEGDPGLMLLWIGAVFVSILVHELGHALTARSFGWEPWITLHGFGGLASYQPTHRSPRKQILITLAGPGAGFAFAAAILAVVAAAGHSVYFTKYGFPYYQPRFESVRLNELVFDLLFINIFWGLVNLLPVIPLDGGQVAREVLTLANPQDGLRQALWLSIVTGAVVAVLAFTQLGDQFLAMFFAYLAYTSYATLQAYFGPGGGPGGFR